PNAAQAPMSIPAAADLSAQPALIGSGTEPGSEAITLPFRASVVQVRSEIVSTVISNADLVQPPWAHIHLSSGIARMSLPVMSARAIAQPLRYPRASTPAVVTAIACLLVC